jgi:hypothetical protein
MTTANEILKQLGGNKFIAMTGATCYSDNNGQTLVTKFKGSRIANIMYITLNSMDLYDVKIAKYRNCDVNVISQVNNVYSDMLKPMFEEVTKLRTSL